MPNLTPNDSQTPPSAKSTLTHPPELAFYPFRGRRDAKLNHESHRPSVKSAQSHTQNRPHTLGLSVSQTVCEGHTSWSEGLFCLAFSHVSQIRDIDAFDLDALSQTPHPSSTLKMSRTRDSFESESQRALGHVGVRVIGCTKGQKNPRRCTPLRSVPKQKRGKGCSGYPR